MRLVLQHRDVQKLLKDPMQRFDLVVAEWIFNDVYTGMAALFDCPMIWFSSTESHWMILLLVNEATDTVRTSTMTERVPQSASTYLKDKYLYNLEKEIFKNIFGPLMALRGKPLCSYDEARYFASQVFVYSPIWYTTGWPQNFKQISGFHIEQNVKPLAKDLKSIMDNAKNGVIYFSLGAYLQSKDVPGVSKRKLIDMFSRLKQTIILKLESDYSNLPRNIHILKWAPQQSILSHPNCVLFITHGGILSMTESLHFGVPIIGIPVFGDQFTNVEGAVEKGFAMKVDLSYSLIDNLKDAIKEMLSNSRYRNKVKELQLIYYSRSTSSRVELLYWINHTIHSGVSHHLRSALNVPLYKNAYLHLVLAVSIVLFSVTLTTRRSLSLLLKSKQKIE